jgi:serine/threonine protein kinase
VYRCEQPALGRDVVIKVIHEARRDRLLAQQRFLREAQLASQLEHPYAAYIYDFGVEASDQLMWLVMERVRGVTLSAWLHANGAMPFG